VTGMAPGTEEDVVAGDAEEQLVPGFLGVGDWIWVGGSSEELLTEGEELFAAVVGQEPIVSDAHESGGEEVEQEAPQELGGVEGQVLDLVAMGTIPPAERDVAVVDGIEAVVGDGDAVGVATEVAEDLVGAGERRLAVDHPLLARRLAQPRVAIATWAAEAAGIEGPFEELEELAAEDLGEDTDEEEEPGLGGDPSLALGAEAATGDDAVEMRMVGEGLGPGMEDGGEADAGSEVLGPPGDVLEGFGDGAEEQVVTETPMGAQEWMEHVGDREDHVVVLDG